MSQPQQKSKDRSNAFLAFMTPTCNLSALTSINDRNLEALTIANEAITECAQAIVKRQAEIMQSGTDSAMQLFQDVYSFSESPETHLGKHIEFGRVLVEDTLANMDDMIKIIAKSNTAVVAAMTDCLTHAFTETCNLTKNKGSANHVSSSAAHVKKTKQQEAA